MEEFDTKRNLIVNYLPSTLSQDDVNMLFSRIGPVSKCKLVRNNVTGVSMGYAFIEYPTEQLAANAIAQINGVEMEGKTLKVSYARPSSEETKNTNVYIASLPLSVTETKLRELFSPFGTIITNKLLTNPDGSSRGAGFVRYSTNSEALAAISAMAGKTLPESNGPLTVKLAIPPKQNVNSGLSAITTNMLSGVGAAARNSNVRFNPLSISQNVNSASSIPITQNFNQVAGVPINQSINSVVASNVQNMNSVSNMPLNQNMTPGASMPVVMAMGAASQPACVYVYGLQPTHTELTLYELFSPFGGILNVKLVRDLTKDEKPCKGYGFVNFTKFEDAHKAVISMNNVPFESKILQVSFKQNKTPTAIQNVNLKPVNMVSVAT